MKPADTLLLGVAVLAAVLFIGGVIDVFRAPVRRRRRRRKSDPSRLADQSPVPRPLRPLDVPAWHVFPKPKSAPASLEASAEHAGVEFTEAVPPLDSRPPLFGVSAVCIIAVLGMFLLRGGGTVSDRPPDLSDLSPRRQAEALAARGDYAGAWGLYNQALRAAPEDISLWYALGVTLSRMDQRKEAEEAFQYVVRRGRPDSEEVQRARRWLISAGVLAEDPTSVSSPRREREPGSSEPAAVRPSSSGASTVGGRVRGSTEARTEPRPIQLTLEGEEDSNREVAFEKDLKMGEPYEFTDVPPGNYRLKVRDRDSEAQLWDVPVTVKVGKETVLDLTGASGPLSAASQ